MITPWPGGADGLRAQLEHGADARTVLNVTEALTRIRPETPDELKLLADWTQRFAGGLLPAPGPQAPDSAIDDAPVSDADEYRAGWAAGIVDSQRLTTTPNQDGYTHDEYQRITSTYARAIFALRPSPWERGYGDAMDAGAEALGHRGEDVTDEDIERVREFLG